MATKSLGRTSLLAAALAFVWLFSAAIVAGQTKKIGADRR
jgi:hypothetical protein